MFLVICLWFFAPFVTWVSFSLLLLHCIVPHLHIGLLRARLPLRLSLYSLFFSPLKDGASLFVCVPYLGSLSFIFFVQLLTNLCSLPLSTFTLLRYFFNSYDCMILVILTLFLSSHTCLHAVLALTVRVLSSPCLPFP